MNLYEYSVWFKDKNSLPDDQDYEWVACFIVKALSVEQAKLWGDELSKSYVVRNSNNMFINSSVKLSANNNLPVIKFGNMASDEYIGW